MPNVEMMRSALIKSGVAPESVNQMSEFQLQRECIARNVELQEGLNNNANWGIGDSVSFSVKEQEKLRPKEMLKELGYQLEENGYSVDEIKELIKNYEVQQLMQSLESVKVSNQKAKTELFKILENLKPKISE